MNAAQVREYANARTLESSKMQRNSFAVRFFIPGVLIGMLAAVALGLVLAGWLRGTTDLAGAAGVREGARLRRHAVLVRIEGADRSPVAHGLAATEAVSDVWPRAYLPLVQRAFSGREFAFAVTSDVRSFAGPGAYDTPQYFRGACETIDGMGGAFMVTPGDIDPVTGVLWTITRTLGITYTWYPVVGNHERPGAGEEASLGANMDLLNGYEYGAVNPGPTGCPTTTYSFDLGDAHFAVLNEYCDSAGDAVTLGDVPDHLYTWLAQDLSSTDKPHVFVVGHEPAYPQPDADSGRLRHLGESLDKYPANRDRFWNLLRNEGVLAYICGHTHNYSAVQLDGVWQLDAGHARGLGDTGARSTFIVIHVDGEWVTFETYRDDYNGGPYSLADTGVLAGP